MRMLSSLVLVVSSLFLGLMLLLFVFQEKMVFFPEKRLGDTPEAADPLPVLMPRTVQENCLKKSCIGNREFGKILFKLDFLYQHRDAWIIAPFLIL